MGRLVFLRKYPEQKKIIYRVLAVACLHLKKYRKSLTFLVNLLPKEKDNMFYILLINIITRVLPVPHKLSMYKLHYRVGENPDLLYLIAFEHIDSGYFEVGVKALARIESMKDTEEMINLNLAICFVQIASSRNTRDKLSMVNRSAYFM